MRVYTLVLQLMLMRVI